MSNKRWKTGLLLSAASTAVLLSGCSGNKTDAGGTEAQQGAKPMTLKMIRYEHPSQALKQNTPVLKEIAKQTGVTLQVEGVPQSNYKDKKQVLIGTNNIPDVILVDQNDIFQYAKTGIFLNISDYLDQAPNLKKRLQDNPETNKLLIDGKLYGFPITAQNQLSAGKAPMIRTDLLKKHNLKTPATYDELYATLKQLKAAYPDSTPWTARGMGSILDAVAYGMGSGYGMYFDPDVKGGSYVYGTNKPEFKEVLAYLNKLYAEKLLDPDFAVNTQQKWAEKLSTGKAFFYFDNNTFAVNYNQAMQKDNPEAKLDLIPYLGNGKGSIRGFAYPKAGWISELYAVSSKVKDPAAIVKFYDWLYSEEGTLVANFGVRGETFDIANGKPKLLDAVIDKYKTAADPARAMLSELGAGYLTIAPHVDETPIIQVSDPDLVRWGEQIDKDPGSKIRAPSLKPPFTDEENEQIKQITSKLSPILADVLKFIMGAKPLGEFDAFVKALNDNGVPQLETIYNTAMSRVKR
ncbi:extracellular solute-binding protein [Paenibacillus hemerocallicola]|uniref:Extracellular solute-binding protein n=1 Tax=Paenibacillus hemerocallicola TaxID=1172614 RepID=A0A5C4SY47_9BACL|nr:extracellular solute-binding protein [Paenibacillus hemerocallicola]TNJ61528.1 extracellular solute-binding protein [Paenibacillus hemerocallicola]